MSKMDTTKCIVVGIKKMITSKRFEMGLFKMNLVRTNIISIVNYAWGKSFANVQNNHKDIADRVWRPINRIIYYRIQTLFYQKLIHLIHKKKKKMDCLVIL